VYHAINATLTVIAACETTFQWGMVGPMDETIDEQHTTTGPRMMRLFVALETNDAMRRTFVAAQQTLQQRGNLPVRWTKPEHAHLTLQFLGNVMTTHIPSLTDALTTATAPHSAFMLREGVVGAFPSLDAPRVLWLGMRGAVDALLALHQSVAEALRQVEGIVADRKPFQPHLTLARVRNGRRAAPEATALAVALRRPVAAPPAGWPIAHVSLIRSVLGAGGSRYTVVERFPLGIGAETR
jgi:2'-5' RNA ligase